MSPRNFWQKIKSWFVWRKKNKSTPELVGPVNQPPNFEKEQKIAQVKVVKKHRDKNYWQVRSFFIFIILLVIAFILWACFFPLDIATLAPGVVSDSSSKPIQHLDGGIVYRLYVKEGQHVLKNEPLVELDPVNSMADLQQLDRKIDAEQLDVQRLQAEIEDQPILKLSPLRQIQNPLLLAETEKLFYLRQSVYNSELKSREEDVIQKTKELEQITERLIHEQQELKLILNQVKISENLLKEGINSQYTHLQLLREAKAVESKVAEDTINVTRVQSELKEANNKLQSYISQHHQELSEQLEEKRRQLSEDEQKRVKFAAQFSRTTLYSPVDGIVSELNVSGPGQVVKPGETIMSVLPKDAELTVTAKLQVQQVGYVHVGQRALVRMASADARNFNGIESTVIYLSPDAFTDKDQPNNPPYYKVKVKAAKPYFERGSVRYQLYPGMRVAVAIVTGERSVMSYLLDPIFGIYQTALQER